MKALAAVMGLKVNDRQRDLRQHHPGPRRRQVRRRRLVVHRHQGAREDRRLRRLLHRRQVVLHEGLGRDDDQHGSPTSAATRSPSRRARPRRPTPTAQSKKCTKAGKPAVTVLVVPRPERRQPRALERPRAARLRRLAGRRLRRSRSQTGSSSSSARRYANAPYGLAVPKNSGLAQADAGRAQGADEERQYTAILTHWGIQAGAISNPARSTARRARQSTRLRLRGEHLRAFIEQRTGRPEEIKAVPVRRPGPLDRRGDRAVIVAASIVRVGRHQPALRVARRRPVPVRPADPPRGRR